MLDDLVDRWCDYADCVHPGVAYDDGTLADERQAFMAGVLVMFAALDDMERLTEAESQRWLFAWRAQCCGFVAESVRKVLEG